MTKLANYGNLPTIEHSTKLVTSPVTKGLIPHYSFSVQGISVF